MYYIQDGTEVTSEQIASAFGAGNAIMVHGYNRDGGIGTALAIDGIERDTRGECPRCRTRSGLPVRATSARPCGARWSRRTGRERRRQRAGRATPPRVRGLGELVGSQAHLLRVQRAAAPGAAVRARHVRSRETAVRGVG